MDKLSLFSHLCNQTRMLHKSHPLYFQTLRSYCSQRTMSEMTQTSLSSATPIGATSMPTRTSDAVLSARRDDQPQFPTPPWSPTWILVPQVPRRLRWMFTDEEQKSTPSVQAGYKAEKEQRYRQEMGRFVQVCATCSPMNSICEISIFIFFT